MTSLGNRKPNIARKMKPIYGHVYGAPERQNIDAPSVLESIAPEDAHSATQCTAMTVTMATSVPIVLRTEDIVTFIKLLVKSFKKMNLNLTMRNDEAKSVQ